ncbi:GNAT family N-acetyltransferase [Undibacterium sp. TC9W]|uniref:GNAT family N-acetyltransferase n=1 Tax=Undibacterium sp. TC9W TaxID=3413053 RepID=UPI003BF38840
MNIEIIFSQNQATLCHIAEHLRQCDTEFMPPLSSRLNIDDYAYKIWKRAMKFEAITNGKLVGLLAMYCNDKLNQLAFITNVSVLPEYQHQGIGLKLLNQSLAYAKKSAFLNVDLEVNNNDVRAIDLYSRIGFFHHSLNEDTSQMRCSLV